MRNNYESMSDRQLVILARENDPDALYALFMRYEPLINKVFFKYFPNSAPGDVKDDFIADSFELLTTKTIHKLDINRIDDNFQITSFYRQGLEDLAKTTFRAYQRNMQNISMSARSGGEYEDAEFGDFLAAIEHMPVQTQIEFKDWIQTLDRDQKFWVDRKQYDSGYRIQDFANDLRIGLSKAKKVVQNIKKSFKDYFDLDNVNSSRGGSYVGNSYR
jgi:hypothetical protein